MSKLLAKAVTHLTADVPMTNTVETGIIQGPRVPVRVATCLVHVRAWVQWVPGADTTGVRARLYRGAQGEGGVISEVNLMPLGAGAGATETVMIEAVEGRSNAGSAQYLLTMQAEGATASSNVLQGVLETEVLSG